MVYISWHPHDCHNAGLPGEYCFTWSVFFILVLWMIGLWDWFFLLLVPSFMILLPAQWNIKPFFQWNVLPLIWGSNRAADVVQQGLTIQCCCKYDGGIESLQICPTNDLPTTSSWWAVTVKGVWSLLMLPFSSQEGQSFHLWTCFRHFMTVRWWVDPPPLNRVSRALTWRHEPEAQLRYSLYITRHQNNYSSQQPHPPPLFSAH